MLLKLDFAVTIPNVSGRRNTRRMLPGSLQGGRARFPFAADRRGFLCKVIISNQRANGAQMSRRIAAHLPLGIKFQPGRATKNAPTLDPRAFAIILSGLTRNTSGLAPDEQEPVTWLPHPPIKIIT
ncbi:MAG TPA: hypothetical protein VLJ61_12765 [Pyrinomonadaceae bacterium]|nr:hypothetical protein [Pyrinomonadaceae bacterium]